MKNFIKTTILVISLISTDCFSQNLQDSFYTTKPNGMGGAFNSIANDKNTVWFNPAGISRMRRARSRKKLHIVNFPNLQATWNENGESYVASMIGGGSDEGISSIISDNATEFSTENIFANVGLFPMIGFDTKKRGQTPMIIGAYAQTRLTSIIDTSDISSGTTTASTAALADVGVMYDIAWNTKSNLFSMGLQVRGIKRYDYQDILSTDVLLDQDALLERMKEYSNSTIGVALDFGFIWTFADIWLPTLAFSVMNAPLSCHEDYLNPFSMTRQTVCGTVFQGDIKNNDAISLVDPTNIMLGVSMTPRITRKVGFRIALEAHNLKPEVGEQNWGLSDVSFARKIHAGLELFYGNPLEPNKFSLVTGFKQGYITYGVNMRLGALELAYANYSEDISNTTESRQDQRQIVELSLQF